MRKIERKKDMERYKETKKKDEGRIGRREKERKERNEREQKDNQKLRKRLL